MNSSNDRIVALEVRIDQLQHRINELEFARDGSSGTDRDLPPGIFPPKSELGSRRRA